MKEITFEDQLSILSEQNTPCIDQIHKAYNETVKNNPEYRNTKKITFNESGDYHCILGKGFYLSLTQNISPVYKICNEKGMRQNLAESLVEFLKPFVYTNKGDEGLCPLDPMEITKLQTKVRRRLKRAWDGPSSVCPNSQPVEQSAGPCESFGSERFYPVEDSIADEVLNSLDAKYDCEIKSEDPYSFNSQGVKPSSVACEGFAFNLFHPVEDSIANESLNSLESESFVDNYVSISKNRTCRGF